MQVQNKHVVMAVGKNFDESETFGPKKYLEDYGIDVKIVGIEHGEIVGKKGNKLEVNSTFTEVSPDDFDLLLIPGGSSPEYLRVHDPAVEFVRRFVESGKPVAAICHGPQLLISAGVLHKRRLTSVNRIRDDIRNAGGNYVDEPLVEDDNLITSRTVDDLPIFQEALGRSLGLS